MQELIPKDKKPDTLKPDALLMRSQGETDPIVILHSNISVCVCVHAYACVCMRAGACVFLKSFLKDVRVGHS